MKMNGKRVFPLYPLKPPCMHVYSSIIIPHPMTFPKSLLEIIPLSKRCCIEWVRIRSQPARNVKKLSVLLLPCRPPQPQNHRSHNVVAVVFKHTTQ